MDRQTQTISLGFTTGRFPPGVHICQIFSSADECGDALLSFLQSGLEAGERACCFSDRVSAARVEEHLSTHGISYVECRDRGALTLARPKDTYFTDGRFDPDPILETLLSYYDTSVRQGYPAARVIGEMVPEIQEVTGGSRLLEYESKVSLLQREHPITCVCQYDARAFDGGMIMDVLKVHPLMVVRGAVVQNPFFLPPEEFLKN